MFCTNLKNEKKREREKPMLIKKKGRLGTSFTRLGWNLRTDLELANNLK
jgi:hypothetical protein